MSEPIRPRVNTHSEIRAGVSVQTGAYSTVEVGSVETLPPGSPAYVSNTGTKVAAVLNFGIPKGAPGQDGQDGQPGVDGADGVTFTPSVDASGNISWTNDGGRQNPPTQNIKGPQGAPGQDGQPGADGADGADGITPTIGENGNWYLGDTDTGKPSRGVQGEKGETGETGPQGVQGIQGIKGDKGDTGEKGDKGDTGAQGPQGATGATGKSAYQSAQDGGYAGTESQFNSDLAEIGGKEDKSNKVTTLSASSTDTQYPSAKTVYDAVKDKVEIPTITIALSQVIGQNPLEIQFTTAQHTIMAKKNPVVIFDVSALGIGKIAMLYWSSASDQIVYEGQTLRFGDSGDADTIPHYVADYDTSTHIAIVDEVDAETQGNRVTDISSVATANVDEKYPTAGAVKRYTQPVSDIEKSTWSAKLGTSGDGSNVTAAFTQASTRANISTGEKLSVLFGKIAKWFADLKTVAFTGNYNDLSNKPTIPTVPTNVSAFTNDAGYLTQHQSLAAYRTSVAQDVVDGQKEAKGKITISGVEKTANTHTVTIVTNGVTTNLTLVGVS